jgi:hypothetical protein
MYIITAIGKEEIFWSKRTGTEMKKLKLYVRIPYPETHHLRFAPSSLPVTYIEKCLRKPQIQTLINLNEKENKKPYCVKC